ncbi:MAG TPA: helix-turn-helix transcriptional regulator [Ktedonobacterales bacterium]|nr:helix-turn-helix transcriptional regulator [Ktedonobacterales bacterium]
MATDGTPELAAKRCGEAIARLRTARRWSRAQLVIRLYDEITPDDPNYESISETWLARLENGRMVKVPRQTIEALCRALRCSSQERAWVLLCADRNVLADDINEPCAIAELLTYVVDRLYAETHEALRSLLGQRDVADLDDLEQYELAQSALDLLIARKRQRLAPNPVREMGGRAPLVPREGRLTPAAQSARTGSAAR